MRRETESESEGERESKKKTINNKNNNKLIQSTPIYACQKQNASKTKYKKRIFFLKREGMLCVNDDEEEDVDKKQKEGGRGVR